MRKWRTEREGEVGGEFGDFPCRRRRSFFIDYRTGKCFVGVDAVTVERGAGGERRKNFVLNRLLYPFPTDYVCDCLQTSRGACWIRIISLLVHLRIDI